MVSNTLCHFQTEVLSHFSIFSELRMFISSSGMVIVVFLSVSWEGILCDSHTPAYQKRHSVPTSNKPKTYPRSLDFIWELESPYHCGHSVLQSDLPRQCSFHKFQKKEPQTERAELQPTEVAEGFLCIAALREDCSYDTSSMRNYISLASVWILYGFLARTQDSSQSFWLPLGCAGCRRRPVIWEQPRCLVRVYP